MAISKILLDGQTLIDLTTDTVASSDDIVQGKVGHLNDGSVVTGTAKSEIISGSIRTTEVNQGVISGSVSGSRELVIGGFTSAVTTNNTELTATINNCVAGDVIVCCFATRNCATPTVSSGWTLMSTSDVATGDTTNQRLNWAKKVAESTTESITITQTSSTILYINMVALPSTAVITDNGYTYFSSSSKNFTVTKPSGLTIWGITTPSRYQNSSSWITSNIQICIRPVINYGYYQYLLTSVDWSDDSTVTFTTDDTFSSRAVVGSLTVTGI